MFEDHAKALDTCLTCPSLCQSACPVFLEDSNRSHSPWGLMQTMNRVRRGQIPFDETVAEMSYHCVGCKGCTTQCEHGIEIPPVLEEARQKAVKSDILPSNIKGFVEKFHRHNNPFSKDLLKRLDEILPAQKKQKDPKAIYFASCTTISKTPEIISDTFSLLNKLKIDFVAPYREAIQCCGYPLLSAGAESDFVDLAEVNYHSLKKLPLIVSGSPACTYTLKTAYKKYHFDLEDKVISINEFLKPYLKNINFTLKKKLRTKLMLHDPCYSVRYLDEGLLMRELIAEVSGYPPGEFFDHQNSTSCSGQGGCYSVIEKERADRITKERLKECYEKDTRTVVTQCPSCVFKMRKNSKRIVVKDLVSYLNDCIEEALS
ncbi:MAG: (Fe-S)-binding protein [Deltaproteobacteria bacterium]|nr:(Fe-S)-binding protein [Deltaproteobacteria bacterium]